MRRIGSLLLAALLLPVLFALAACSGGSSGTAKAELKPAVTASATPRPTSDVRVGIAYDIGGLDDHSYNESAAAGVQRAATELGVTSKALQAVRNEDDEAKTDRLAGLAKGGYNPVIVIGLAYAAPLAKVADDFPKTRFAIVDTSFVRDRNVTSLVFDEVQGSYLVGTIAAQASRTHRIGFIGGVGSPILESFAHGFEDGAKAASPGVKVAVKYLSQYPDNSGFTDPERGASVAKDLYADGTDVIYTVAFQSNSGVFEAAADEKSMAIGMDSDQYQSAGSQQKPAILTSMVKQIDVAVFAMIKSVVDDDPLTGVRTFGLKQGGIAYSTSNPRVKPYEATAQQYEQKIISGAVKVKH